MLSLSPSVRSLLVAAFCVAVFPFASASAAQEAPPSCPYCALAGIDLSGRDLTDANLTGADLRGAILRGADLDGAMLIGAQLQGADLDDATLNPSAIGPANLSRADLSGASLEGTEMEGAILQYTILPSREGSATPQPAALARAALAEYDCAEIFAAAGSEGVACGQADLSGLASRVYVSGSGTDAAGCGASTDATCATIGYGIGQCAGSGCGVLVACGEYSLAEPIDLRAGVNVYGGCLPQSLSFPQSVSVIEAPAAGQPAVRATGIDTPTVLQGFEIAASDTCAHLESSADCPSGAETVAVVVDDSQGLSILDSQLVANVGAPGYRGSDGSSGGSGDGGSGQTAGTNGSCSNTQGGKGGSQMDVETETWVDFPLEPESSCTKVCAENSCQGYAGGPGQTGSAAAGGGTGSTVCSESCLPPEPGPGGKGGPGLGGACGAAGEPSTDTAGTFAGLDWSPSVGGDGGDGADGGGGGGGGAGGYQSVYCVTVSQDSGNRGGGGGAGGCKGTGGSGGTQGGASFALIARASHVDLTGSTIVAGQGGPGGDGGTGAKGGIGGTGATGGSGVSADGGDGGRGGDGGDGGSGAGGAGGNGGPTVGVALLDGATVAAEDTAFYPGRSAANGAGGPGGGAPSTDSCGGPQGEDGRPGTVLPIGDYR